MDTFLDEDEGASGRTGGAKDGDSSGEDSEEGEDAEDLDSWGLETDLEE